MIIIAWILIITSVVFLFINELYWYKQRKISKERRKKESDMIPPPFNRPIKFGK